MRRSRRPTPSPFTGASPPRRHRRSDLRPPTCPQDHPSAKPAARRRPGLPAADPRAPSTPA